ncbi:hypothetical protein E0J20_09185 [Rhizobium leguminosarum bv. viciae]|nr:hypothetical protein E0J20_09185 [Rhizobium leguminosarum bv. viciae]
MELAKALAKARDVSPAEIWEEAMAAYIDFMPRLKATTEGSEIVHEVKAALDGFAGFIEVSVAAFAQVEALKEEVDDARKGAVEAPKMDDFDYLNGPDFAAEEAPVSSTLEQPVKPSW